MFNKISTFLECTTKKNSIWVSKIREAELSFSITWIKKTIEFFCWRVFICAINWNMLTSFFLNIRSIIHRFFLFNASINEFVRLWASHMISIQFEDLEVCHCCVEDWICNIILVSFSYVDLFFYSKNEIFAAFKNEDVLKEKWFSSHFKM
jgi:hypothetical protein